MSVSVCVRWAGGKEEGVDTVIDMKNKLQSIINESAVYL